MSLLLAGAWACGADDEGDDFTACGGTLTAGDAQVWNFTAVALTGAACGTDPVSVSGFLNFNGATGRYSLNAGGKGWSLPGQTECGFNTGYGGFYKTEGSKVCFADSEADLAAAPCDESGFDMFARPRSGAADYCVAGTTLQLSTHTFLGATGGALFTLAKQQ